MTQHIASSTTKGKTVFDVGMHIGQDTAFYLACGYRVIAVEANPVLVKAAQDRFHSEIDAGQLVIVPCCISNTSNEDTPFWINSVDSALSSFDRDATARMGHPVQSINVRSSTLAELLEEYGTPYYVKIDIEGADRFCLADLSTKHLPQFVSVELTDLAFLPRLHSLGYTKFKLIEQRTLTPLTERITWDSYFLNLMCKDLERKDFGLRVRRRIARWLLPLATAYEANFVDRPVSQCVPDWVFTEGSSGPFGDDAAGSWATWEETTYLWSKHVIHTKKRKAELWCDLHATF